MISTVTYRFSSADDLQRFVKSNQLTSYLVDDTDHSLTISNNDTYYHLMELVSEVVDQKPGKPGE